MLRYANCNVKITRDLNSSIKFLKLHYSSFWNEHCLPINQILQQQNADVSLLFHICESSKGHQHLQLKLEKYILPPSLWYNIVWDSHMLKTRSNKMAIMFSRKLQYNFRQENAIKFFYAQPYKSKLNTVQLFLHLRFSITKRS